jgi:Tol biopolymer transport system component/tRNA A-37 threonylcarbamoyl transferase component Bud32
VSDPLERLKTALAGRYDIEREIGSGGMATVYLAEDLRHHRKVAIKVLRPDLAATLGPERFLREIEVAAKLQHPHILPLHDSGEADGFLYYVMPFVEGQSLRDKLAKEGELPVGEAVRILRDVVDALTEAHANGVVHRDIKPENILLRGRHALVTDFGVAKAVSEATGREQLTTAGVALGTPNYMAPEQASADPHLDHRVDIYAVGAVAYELLTGRPVFMGTTPQMILSAHVTEAPQPVTKHRDTVPPALEQLVLRCLEKKPADRWQSAEELLPQLEALATPSGGITPTDTRPVSAVPAYGRRGRVAAVAAVVVILAVAVVTVQLLRSKPLTITVSDITLVTSEPGVEFQPALSPDGGEVAFVQGPIGAPHLVIRSTANIVGGGEVRLADTSTEGEVLPTWAPDGDFVRFLACRTAGCVWSETGKLGGAVRPLPIPSLATAAAWSPNGEHVAFAIADTVFTSPVSELAVSRVAVIPTAKYLYVHSLAWSPDGTRIALVAGNAAWQFSGNVMSSSIWVVDAAEGEPQLILPADCLNVSPVWLDANHLLFVSNRDGPRGVYVVEVGRTGARGAPRIVPGVADPHSISYSIAARRLAYAKFTLRQNVRSYPLDRRTPISVRDGSPLTSGTQVIETHDVSPDRRWLAYDSNLRGGMDLYRLALTGGESVQLSDSPVDDFDPRWSPGGGEIVFTRLAPGSGGQRVEVAVLPAAGGAVSVIESATNAAFPVWSPSGSDIAFTSLTGRGEAWLVSRDSVGAPWHGAVQLTDFGCYPRDWAPDGSGVLCGSSTESVLTLVSPTGTVLWRLDLATGNHLALLDPAGADVRYGRDGSTIYFGARHEDGRSGVWAMPARGGEARLVIALDDPSVTVPGYLSVGADRLFLTVSEYESDIWVMDLEW